MDKFYKPKRLLNQGCACAGLFAVGLIYAFISFFVNTGVDVNDAFDAYTETGGEDTMNKWYWKNGFNSELTRGLDNIDLGAGIVMAVGGVGLAGTTIRASCLTIEGDEEKQREMRSITTNGLFKMLGFCVLAFSCMAINWSIGFSGLDLSCKAVGPDFWWFYGNFLLTAGCVISLVGGNLYHYFEAKDKIPESSGTSERECDTNYHPYQPAVSSFQNRWKEVISKRTVQQEETSSAPTKKEIQDEKISFEETENRNLDLSNANTDDSDEKNSSDQSRVAQTRNRTKNSQRGAQDDQYSSDYAYLFPNDSPEPGYFGETPTHKHRLSAAEKAF